MTTEFLAAASYMSLTKVVLCAAALLAWTFWAALVDKDADYFRQKRRMWNGVQTAAAGLAYLMIFLIPFFPAGFILGLAVMIGAGSVYAVTRNKAVAEKDRWKLNADFFLNAINSKRQKRAEKTASLKIKSASGAPPDLKPIPLHTDERYAAHLQIEEVLNTALERHAQSITLTGTDTGYSVMLSIDGVDFRRPTIPAAEAKAAVKYLMTHCALDVNDSRKPQHGKCNIDSQAHGGHELHVKTSGSTKGFTCCISFDPVKQITIAFKDLGLLDSQLAQLEPVLQKEGGVIVVASLPHQGRTTTLYAITATHDPYTLDIHTIEEEVEREMDSVTHNKLAAPEQFKKLKSLLIRDPHVITVTNVADSQSAKLICEGAMQGKRLYAGLKGESAFAALQMWMKAVGDNEMLSKSIYAVIAQKLVRKLCPVCKAKYRPDAVVLKKLNVGSQKVKELYKMGGKVMIKDEPTPCPACHGVGFQGRFAAFEVLLLDDDESRKFLAAGDLSGLRNHVRRRKMQWMEEAAFAKVVSGVTSINEAMRAMGQEKETAPAASAGNGGKSPAAEPADPNDPAAALAAAAAKAAKKGVR